MRRLLWVMVLGPVALYAGPDSRLAKEAAGAEAAVAPVAERTPPPKLATALAQLERQVRRDTDGSLAIATGAYRATFDAVSGVVYVPRIGPRLEPRLRWQYRARTLEIGGRARTLEPVAPRVSPTGEHVVDFERPGLIERYEAESRGVEQLFVLSTRPAGSGDVRISGEVTFAGTMRASADGGFVFTAPGLPGFTYAAPVAFDAAGTRLPVRAELRQTTLSLVLDGAALATARFPVTIDPLFGVTTVATGTLLAPAIAYNPARAEYLIVYARDDQGVYARRYTEMGDPLGQELAVAAGDLVAPAVSYDYHLDRYLVAWFEFTGNALALRARLADGTGAAVGSTITLTNLVGSSEASHARVTARNHREHAAADVAFAVAWSERLFMAGEKLTRVARVRGSGAVAGTDLLATQSCASDSYTCWSGTPAVSYDPSADRFFVAYALPAFVAVRTLSTSGTLGPEGLVATHGGCAQQRVAFDPTSRRHLVVYQVLTAHGTCDVRGQLYASSNGTATPIGSTLMIAAASASVNYDGVSVAAEPGTFLVSYVEYGALDLVVAQRRRADGLLVSTTTLDSGAPDTIQRFTAMAAAAHGGTPAVFSGPPSPQDLWPVRLSLTNRWYARYVHGGTGDVDGDGRGDLLVARPHTSSWIARTQSGTTTYPGWFLATGVPVLLDWDGDGRADLGSFAPGSGVWLIRTSQAGGFVSTSLGRAGDIPIAGNFQGDARDEIGVFRPSTATWILRSPGSIAETVTSFGQVGDMPVPADWDGDGDIDIGIWRPSTGRWYALDGWGTPISVPSTPWGGAGDFPLAGNFVGDATADQVVYRRQLGVFYIRDGATGATSTVSLGSGLPMPLDWDGDGKLNPAVFDVESGLWLIRDGWLTTTVTFGGIGDIPAAR